MQNSTVFSWICKCQSVSLLRLSLLLTCTKYMDTVDGEGAARYIKSTNSKNTHTPIIAVSAYCGTDPSETNGLFTASLSKPLQKADLLAVMRQLGFKTTTLQGVPGAPKLTASHATAS